MKSIILYALLAFMLCFRITLGQEQGEKSRQTFQLNGDLITRYIFSTNEPSFIQNNYDGKYSTPKMQFDFDGKTTLPLNLRLNFHPYFQMSESQGVTRVGLIGNLCEDFDFIQVGWRHHSYHNADLDTPSLGGRSQDAPYVAIPLYAANEKSVSRFSLVFSNLIFVRNSHPIEIRSWYPTSGYPTALTEHALTFSVFDLFVQNLDAHINALVQIGDGKKRYGSENELRYRFNKNVFLSAEYLAYTAGDTRHTFMIGLGLSFN